MCFSTPDGGLCAGENSGPAGVFLTEKFFYFFSNPACSTPEVANKARRNTQGNHTTDFLRMRRHLPHCPVERCFCFPFVPAIFSTVPFG